MRRKGHRLNKESLSNVARPDFEMWQFALKHPPESDTRLGNTLTFSRATRRELWVRNHAQELIRESTMQEPGHNIVTNRRGACTWVEEELWEQGDAFTIPVPNSSIGHSYLLPVFTVGHLMIFSFACLPEHICWTHSSTLAAGCIWSHSLA